MSTDDTDYDVVVVGGGGAGMTAALTAVNAGARVAVVEAAERLGGSTALAGGVIYAGGTSVQRAAGISDTAEDMYHYYMTLNQFKLKPAIVWRLCREAAAAVDWLISIGVKFSPEGLYKSGVETVARGHNTGGGGAAITAALEYQLSEKGVDISLKARVKDLIVDNGAVRGIDLGDYRVRAGSVVIATGGFAHNQLLINRYYPEAARHNEWVWGISAPTCRGDGLLMGQRVGADVTGHNTGLLLVTPGFYRDLEVYVPGWLVFVNREGRRFCDETIEYAVMSGLIKEQIGSMAFAIFDDESRVSGPRPTDSERFPDGFDDFSWSQYKLDEQIKAGKVVVGNTLGELAEKCGIQADTLINTVARYNADQELGQDSQFMKEGAEMRPIKTPPFYAAAVRPAIVCLTSAGLRVDEDMQVLTAGDAPIRGLYAAGEVAGGVLGERYVGGGNSILNAIVYGRVAGANAARLSLGSKCEAAAESSKEDA